MPDHRLHRYEVLHNKLSGLEVLPVDCNSVEIQSVFHNPLVELAVYRHPCHHQKTGQLHPSGMQYILAVGRSDITDVLTNTAGGLLGLAVYSMAARLIGNRIKANRLFSILAGIVSVVVIGLLGFLLFANR